MNTKNMTVEQAEKEIEFLKKRIDFNNRINKIARKFMKDHEMGWSKKNNFNGFQDEATPEMISIMKDALSKEDWMPSQWKEYYLRDTAAIFGGVYSVAVNTYVLKDLHDCEKFLELHKSIEDNNKEDESNDLFRVERDIDSNRINLYFDDKPEEDVRRVLKSNGFRWSPSFSCWTRQLTNEAERALERIKRELNID